jgi:hypothetical protein
MDYSLCVNHFCPLRETCARGIPSNHPRQSYNNFVPSWNGHCEHWIRREEKDDLRSPEGER